MLTWWSSDDIRGFCIRIFSHKWFVSNSKLVSKIVFCRKICRVSVIILNRNSIMIGDTISKFSSHHELVLCIKYIQSNVHRNLYMKFLSFWVPCWFVWWHFFLWGNADQYIFCECSHFCEWHWLTSLGKWANKKCWVHKNGHMMKNCVNNLHALSTHNSSYLPMLPLRIGLDMIQMEDWSRFLWELWTQYLLAHFSMHIIFPMMLLSLHICWFFQDDLQERDSSPHYMSCKSLMT